MYPYKAVIYMKRKTILLGVTAFGFAVLASGLALGKTGADRLFVANGGEASYGMSFGPSKNKLHDHTGNVAYDGEATLKTDLGSDVGFGYYQVKGVASTWQVLGSGGYFYNIDPIRGIKTISLSFKTAGLSYRILYSKDASFDQSAEFVSATGSAQTFDFGGYLPNHFKVLNAAGSNLNISSAEMGFSCLNNYPLLSLSSEDASMGSVGGPAWMAAGEDVTIEATPNEGYRFVGWYSGGELVSEDASYSFTAGHDDLSYTARFAKRSYNLVVQSESEEMGSVSDSSGAYDYLTPISIKASANDGYSFVGWYSGGSLVSESNPYSFKMPHGDSTYTARFAANHYDVALNNADPSLGTISGAGSFPYKGSVTLTAAPNVGVSFLGWYDADGDVVSASPIYTFDMPHEDLAYTARFEWTPYSVELSANDPSMGTVSGAGSYTYLQAVTICADPAEHHSFAGWYDGDELVSMENPYVFELPDRSLVYTAKFVKNYKISVSSDDESMGSVSAPSEWGEGLEVTVSASAAEGYAIDYWYDDDLNEVSYDASYTFAMPGHDVSLGASFAVGYSLTLSSSDEALCAVSGAGRYKAGRNVTVAVDCVGDTFIGWYSGDGLVSKDNPYTFAMPSGDLSLEARVMTKAEAEEKQRKAALGIDPVVDSENGTLTYGLYPQTHVNDDDLAEALDNVAASQSPQSNGWYLYDGKYYARKSAAPYSSDYVFDDGVKIASGMTYWFECEPITWKILSSENGEYSIVSTVLLDAHRYASSSNNYANSEIRTWLNVDFYGSAFSLDKTLIQTIRVDNSASTTNSSSNSYACSNTYDNVYLLSYKDYTNAEYFADSAARRCKTTDWARANGAYYSTNSSYLYNGYYWTRSPLSSYSCSACYVYRDGDLSDYSVYGSLICVRPALTINLQ